MGVMRRIASSVQVKSSSAAAAANTVLPRLSKSRYQTGLQCEKALYLTCYRPDLATPPSEMDRATQENGNKIGILAQQAFPGGELIDEPYFDVEQALAHTESAIADGKSSIFEATFMHENTMVKCDVLENNGDGTFDITEVKSATGVKDPNITDLAVQLYVLKGAGIKIRNAYLMHLNSDYVYPGGEHDLSQLFTRENVTDPVKKYAREVREDLREMKKVLRNPDQEPVKCIGRHCKAPHLCSFYEHCHSTLPEHPITELPLISEKLMDKLIADDIWAIKDIPENYAGLTPKQQRVREAVVGNNVRIHGNVKGELSALKYPLHFLDFETVQNVVPEYVGTHPYQQIPFQWSDHVMVAPKDEDVIHAEFLHTDATDPRRSFAESLLRTMEQDQGNIVVYSNFEQQRLKELARDFKDLEPRLEKVIGRLYNLEKTVNTSVNHPEFKGKTSIKYVLPAMVAENDYADLDIKNGAVAMTRYRKAVAGEMTPEEARSTFDNLLTYCGVDTMSMVKVFRALLK
jgi:hypothetical protein